MVGSASVGCSLSPAKKFRPFSDASDIDIAIVNSFAFDSAWRAIRRMNRLTAKSKAQLAAIDEHRKRLVFEGCIATDKFLALLPFGETWARVALEISSMANMNGRAVKFRIYKDVESLREYHERGVGGLFS